MVLWQVLFSTEVLSVQSVWYQNQQYVLPNCSAVPAPGISANFLEVVNVTGQHVEAGWWHRISPQAGLALVLQPGLEGLLDVPITTD